MTLLSMLVSASHRVDKTIQRIKGRDYTSYAIERGWIPDNLHERVLLSLEQCLQELKPNPFAISQSVSSLRQDYGSWVPEGHCDPILPNNSLTTMKKRELRGQIYSSTNLYTTLEILKEIARRDCFDDGAQDAIVDTTIDIVKIETMRGNFDKAISVIDSVIDGHSVWWESRKNVLVRFLGHVYAAQGDYVRAECSFKEVQRRNVMFLEGGDGALLYNHLLALTLVQNGRFEQAELAFDRARTQIPNDISARYFEGYTRLLTHFSMAQKPSLNLKR